MLLEDSTCTCRCFLISSKENILHRKLMSKWAPRGAVGCRVPVRRRKKTRKRKSVWMAGALPHSSTTWLAEQERWKEESCFYKCSLGLSLQRFVISYDVNVSRRASDAEALCFFDLPWEQMWSFDLDSSRAFSKPPPDPTPTAGVVCLHRGAWRGTVHETQTLTQQTIYRFP